MSLKNPGAVKYVGATPCQPPSPPLASGLDTGSTSSVLQRSFMAKMSRGERGLAAAMRDGRPWDTNGLRRYQPLAPRIRGTKAHPVARLRSRRGCCWLCPARFCSLFPSFGADRVLSPTGLSDCGLVDKPTSPRVRRLLYVRRLISLGGVVSPAGAAHPKEFALKSHPLKHSVA